MAVATAAAASFTILNAYHTFHYGELRLCLLPFYFVFPSTCHLGRAKSFVRRLWYECTFRFYRLCTVWEKEIFGAPFIRYTTTKKKRTYKLTNYLNGTTFDAQYWGKWPLKQKVNIIKFVLLKLNYISYLILEREYIFLCWHPEEHFILHPAP